MRNDLQNQSAHLFSVMDAVGNGAYDLVVRSAAETIFDTFDHDEDGRSLSRNGASSSGRMVSTRLTPARASADTT